MNNLLIDTREKNQRALELVAKSWKAATNGSCIIHGLGKSGGDYSLQVEAADGSLIAHPDIRVETKWMSTNGPGDLFRSLTADYERIKRECQNLSEHHSKSLFLIEGKAMDLQAHATRGGVTLNNILQPIFALSANYRIPFIMSDRAPEWLTAWMIAAREHEATKAPDDERPLIICYEPAELAAQLAEDHPAGTQFFCGFPACEPDQLCALMISRAYGFWFFDGEDFVVDGLARRWLKLEREKVAIRAAGGWPAVPDHYKGKIKPLAQYKPNLTKTRQRRKATIIFNDQGEHPLFVGFDTPKDRGVHIQIFQPRRINGELVDVNDLKPTEPFLFLNLPNGLVKDPELLERDLLPKVLERCRKYWKELESCSEESSTLSEEELEETEEQPVSAAKEAEKSTSPGTSQAKEKAGLGATSATDQETNHDIRKEAEMLPTPTPQTDSIILQQVDPADLELAMLKVCGLDKCSKEMQLIALKMANQYGFKLELKHVVPIQGALYITRDGLLHIAHKSGQLDGIVLDDHGKDKEGWFAVISVFRKDMKHPFRYRGRYNGSNRKYGPEMAVKCAESMALRRAFDVGLCSREERFDLEEPAPSPRSNGNTPTPTRPARPARPTLPAPAEKIESPHKDQILKAFTAHNIPLKYMSAVAQLYGEESWQRWSPNEEIATTACVFLELFGWLSKKIGEEGAVTMIQEEVVPLDPMPGIKGMLEAYLGKHCQDTDDIREVEETIIEAFEQLSVSI